MRREVTGFAFGRAGSIVLATEKPAGPDVPPMGPANRDAGTRNTIGGNRLLHRSPTRP